MAKKILLCLWLSFLILGSVFAFTARADDIGTFYQQDFKLNVPIGDVTKFTISNTSNNILGQYIQTWYGFLIGTVGIIATVMIMWGGLRFLTSRGDRTMVGNAQNIIISAITGLVLAFGSYTILYLINPNLLTIRVPNLDRIVDLSEMDISKQIGTDEITVNNNAPSGENTYANGTGGGPNGFGDGLPGLPAPGGPNIKPEIRQIEQDISAATGSNPTNDYRPNSTGPHASGEAVDYPRNTQTNEYFDNLIKNQTPTFWYKGQPGYDLHNVTIGDTTYPELKIINETVNNCWHIATKIK